MPVLDRHYVNFKLTTLGDNQPGPTCALPKKCTCKLDLFSRPLAAMCPQSKRCPGYPVSAKASCSKLCPGKHSGKDRGGRERTGEHGVSLGQVVCSAHLPLLPRLLCGHLNLFNKLRDQEFH